MPIDPILARISCQARKRRQRNSERAREAAVDNQHRALEATRRSRQRQLERLRMYFAPLRAVRLCPELLSAIHVKTTANMALYANLGRHSGERHPEQAREVLATLPLTIEKLLYVDEYDCRPKAGRVQRVLYFQHGTQYFLRVPLKVFPSIVPNAKDQAWLGTIFKLNRRKMDKCLGGLRPVFGAARQVSLPRVAEADLPKGITEAPDEM